MHRSDIKGRGKEAIGKKEPYTQIPKEFLESIEFHSLTMTARWTFIVLLTWTNQKEPDRHNEVWLHNIEATTKFSRPTTLRNIQELAQAGMIRTYKGGRGQLIFTPKPLMRKANYMMIPNRTIREEKLNKCNVIARLTYLLITSRVVWANSKSVNAPVTYSIEKIAGILGVCSDAVTRGIKQLYLTGMMNQEPQIRGRAKTYSLMIEEYIEVRTIPNALSNTKEAKKFSVYGTPAMRTKDIPAMQWKSISRLFYIRLYKRQP